MTLHTLHTITKTKKKRTGQGHGSGRGKTAGRGTKGQKARRTIPMRFDGNQLSFVLRMPFRRGKGRNKLFKNKPVIINVKALNLLPKDTTITSEVLVKNHIVNAEDAKKYGIKILGDGELTRALTVAVPVSQGAKTKIEKAGGTVQVNK